MKILVTGGTGFVGGAIARRLVERGDDVVLLVRTPEKAAALVQLGAEAMRGDLADKESLTQAAHGCQAVVHCAGVPRPASWRTFRRAHVTGTDNLVSAAQAAGTQRFLNVASQAVLFDGTDLDGADESTPYPTRFIDPYSRTKAEGEQIAMAAHDPGGMTVVSVRPAVVWGPGDTTILPIMAKLASGPLGIPAPGDGRKLEATTYIDNLTDGMLIALDHPEAGGRCYFIVDDFEIGARLFLSRQLEAIGVAPRYCRVPKILAASLGWMMDRVAGGLGLPVPLAYFGYRMAVTGRRYETTRAREELGFQPAIDLEDGLRRLADWAEKLGGPEAVANLA